MGIRILEGREWITSQSASAAKLGTDPPRMQIFRLWGSERFQNADVPKVHLTNPRPNTQKERQSVSLPRFHLTPRLNSKTREPIHTCSARELDLAWPLVGFPAIFSVFFSSYEFWHELKNRDCFLLKSTNTPQCLCSPHQPKLHYCLPVKQTLK